jgi:hypothetical protein
MNDPVEQSAWRRTYAHTCTADSAISLIRAKRP